MPTYNCHTHTFTIEHVPADFLPFHLTPLINSLMKKSFLRKALRLLLGKINPFSNRDIFDRYANFVEVASEPSQREIFKRLRSYYPPDTRFIVLPMDMAYMDAEDENSVPMDIPVDIYRQHQELADLRDDFPHQILPFAAVDPRRRGIPDHLKELVERHGFRGIKIYPLLGYPLNHKALYGDSNGKGGIYEYAQKRNIPIMVHCSKGGVRTRNKEISGNILSYTDPDNYIEIMGDFPALRICAAHFGGEKEWQNYFRGKSEENWLSKILAIIRSGKYPNFYTDISYTIFTDKTYSVKLKNLLQDPKMQTQVLFGSDFYMIEAEKIKENELHKSLQRILGDNLFQQITEVNPKRYLGIKAC